MSAAAWSPATGPRVTRRGRRRRRRPGDQPGRREGLPLDRGGLPGRDAAGRRAPAAGSNGARRRRSCSTGPACAARCGSTSPAVHAPCSARPGARPARLAASAPAAACCRDRIEVAATARLWPGPTPPPRGQLRRPCSPRPRRARRRRGPGDLRLCRRRMPRTCSTPPASSWPRRRPRRRHVVNGLLVARFLAAGPACAAPRVRAVLGRASAPPPPASRPCCRACGMSEETPCT